MTRQGPLAGVLVVDLSRMLPGAVLDRQLLDLGARVVKVEEPGAGDPLRHVPPETGGTSAAWAVMLRGAESICLELRDVAGAAVLRRLARSADVLVESFRPGTLEAWELGFERLHAGNPALVWCSLPGYGGGEAVRHRIGHDLNLSAMSGATTLAGGGVPGLQLADVGAGLLAASAVLAALLERRSENAGRRVEVPLASGPLPFVTWAWADAAAGGPSASESLLAGRCPAYRTYRSSDGAELALAALEPKFWVALLGHLGLGEHAGAALDQGEAGCRAADAVAAAFATEPRGHWLALAEREGLPLSAVHDVRAARTDPYYAAAGLVEATPLPDGGRLEALGPWLPGLGRTPGRPAPRLGEHTEAVLAEIGGLEGWTRRD